MVERSVAGYGMTDYTMSWIGLMLVWWIWLAINCNWLVHHLAGSHQVLLLHHQGSLLLLQQSVKQPQYKITRFLPMSECLISATLSRPDMVCCRPEDTPTLHHGVLGLPAHAALPHVDHLLLLQGLLPGKLLPGKGLLVVLQLETGVRRGGGDAGRGGVALLQKSLKLARGGLQH